MWFWVVVVGNEAAAAFRFVSAYPAHLRANWIAAVIGCKVEYNDQQRCYILDWRE